jgi:dTDP-4-dehydrorhamnose reductase
LIGQDELSRGPWLVFGASGLLGNGLCQQLAADGMQVFATVHEHPVDIRGVHSLPWSATNTFDALLLLTKSRPRVIVYAAGITNVDQCESNESLANRLHAEVPGALAAAARSMGSQFVYISTDHLWTGTKSMVNEDEPLQPLNAYARSKAKGEAVVRAAHPSALILRTNFFGRGRPWRQSLSDWILQELQTGKPIHAFADAYFTPIALPLLHRLIIASTAAGLVGTYHAGGGERLSKYEFALKLATWCGFPTALIRRGSLSEANLVAQRPADMSLSTSKLSAAIKWPPPSIADSFQALFAHEQSIR